LEAGIDRRKGSDDTHGYDTTEVMTMHARKCNARFADYSARVRFARRATSH